MPQYQGVWTLPVAARLQSTQQWATDPLYRNTTLLLQADNAPNGAQNNTFLDSSSNNFTITRNGNTTQGTFTPYSLQPGAWGNYFGGAGNYLRAPSSSAFNFGTGDFTIEAWVLDAGSGLGPQIYDAGLSNSAGSLWFGWYTDILYFRIDGTANDITYAYGIPKVWTHVAATRQSGTVRIFINGVQVASGTRNQNVTQQEPYIGYGAGTNSLGYTSNMRVVKGTAVYTSNFTPSPIPLTAITNTSLLTCQSNRFVDNSTNNFTLTVTGTPSVQAFSPFAPQYQYTPSVTGGSGYFDGTGDYLELPLAINTSIGAIAGKQLTFEFWINTSEIAAVTAYNMSLFGNLVSAAVNGRYVIGLLGSSTTSPQSVQFGWTTSPSATAGVTATTQLNQKSWNHVAITINATTASSTTIVIYINGVGQTFTGQNLSSQTVDPNYNFFVGDNRDGTQTFRGYMGGFKISSGIQRTGNFTPPTTPFTSDANTVLLLNFTNAGIVDGTMKNNLETVGNAQVSTSVVKYGTGSMAFDGSGDYLFIPQSNNPQNLNWEFVNGDFTIEFWFRANTVASTQQGLIVKFDGDAGARTDIQYLIGLSGSNLNCNAYQGTANNDITFTSAISINTWYHVAFVRSGNSFSAYLDGTRNATVRTITGALNSGTNWPLQIGRYTEGGVNYDFNGYIDDLRITKGIARYTANFIPPSVALPRQ